MSTLVAKFTKRIKVQKSSIFYEDDLYEIPVIKKGKCYEKLDIKNIDDRSICLIKDEVNFNWYPLDLFHQ